MLPQPPHFRHNTTSPTGSRQSADRAQCTWMSPFHFRQPPEGRHEASGHTNIPTCTRCQTYQHLNSTGCQQESSRCPRRWCPIVPTSQSNELRLRDQDPPEGLNSRTSEPQIVMGWKSRSTRQEPVPLDPVPLGQVPLDPVPLGPSLPASPEAPSAVGSTV